VVGAPVTEELFFRGVLYPYMKSKSSFIRALILVSLLFGVTHGHLMSGLPLCFLAIAFTLVYEWTGNLGASILMHAGFNSLSVTLLLLQELSKVPAS
jgi:uncharacterized protein